MRIRGTKPEFWRSKRIASVSWDARLVLKALESYVDDNGVGEDDIGTIAGDCFLHDLIREPSRTLARVSEAISELDRAGLVWKYTHEDKALLFIAFWESIQRVDKPLKGRNPRPDGTFNYGDSSLREAVANPREASRTIAPVTGEQGNRGTGEQTSYVQDKPASELDSEFDEWWSIYPRKQAKAPALKAFKKARTKFSFETLMSGVRAYALLNVGGDKTKIKLPAGWLNDERWDDEAITSTEPQPKSRLLFCPDHDGYPLPCDRCARDAEIPEGNDF